MDNGLFDVTLMIAVGTALLLALGAVVTILLFLYKRKYLAYRHDLFIMQEAYQQELLRSQLEIQEQTMQTVGREIHDNVGQMLSLVKLNLNTLPPNDDPKTVEKLGHTREYLNRAIADLRGLSKSLNTENRLDAGLAAAIRQELDAIRKTGIMDVTFTQTGEEQRLDSRQELLLFRITQESLNNALKHAHANNIAVSLDYSPDRLSLTVVDDGVGFDSERVITPVGEERGSGLTNIQNRARLIGAEVSIRSTAGQGTTTVLSLPISIPQNHR